jgi:hypothetical protein
VNACERPLDLNGRDDEGLLGAYEFLNLHAFMKYWPPPDRDEILKERSAERRLFLALCRYTYIHETRHFHDFFGSIAGASLFFAHFEMLRNFVYLLEMIKQTNENWSIPFPEWAARSEFREIHLKYLRCWSAYRKASVRFTNAFRPVASNGWHPADYVVHKQGISPSDRVPTFPFSIEIPQKQQRLSIYYPLSLVAILEGIAQALQRTLVECEFPGQRDISAQLTPSMIEHHPPERLDDITDAGGIASSSIQPYNVTDYLLSKYLRIKHGTGRVCKRVPDAAVRHRLSGCWNIRQELG